MTSTSELQSLQEQFAQVPGVAVTKGPGGLTVIGIVNRHAEASIALHGAHVLSFQPRGANPALWVSRHSQFAAKAPIRGGIPICWPWFGPHPDDPAKPAHGFARISQWTVVDISGGEDPRVRLALTDSDATRALWPHPFRLELTVTLGTGLDVELLMQNPGTGPFTCSEALHCYFAVSSVDRMSIEGLHGCAYLDKVAGSARREQTGPIAVTAETDRVYLETTGDCVIVDAGWDRRIRVAKRGSATTVVWNPWVNRSRQLPDFGDEEYREMVCVETANAADDRITVEPGGEHRLATTLSIEA
ncbi:MAG: D-hexose-6-phosphate mutarotase [Acidobacteriota bacterium]